MKGVRYVLSSIMTMVLLLGASARGGGACTGEVGVTMLCRRGKLMFVERWEGWWGGVRRESAWCEMGCWGSGDRKEVVVSSWDLEDYGEAVLCGMPLRGYYNCDNEMNDSV